MRLVSLRSGLTLALLASLFCDNSAIGVTPAEAAPQLGRQIEQFTLRDYRGKERSLAEFEGKPVAVVFVGSDCPLAKLYAPRLEEIFQQFKEQGVGVVAINSNVQDSLEKVGAYARIHKVTFPVLKDPDNHVADLFDAQRTPHAYVLDADRVVRYVGRIDDQYGLGATSGYSKPQLENSYISDAIQNLLDGSDVAIASTEATGCIIGRNPSVTPHGEITYSNQVSRILNNRCVSCHRDGEIAPFPLTDYDEVNGWGEMMLEVIDKGQMPPWFANPEYGEYENDCRLSREEKNILATWVENGSPEGDPANLPEPPKFADGWQIGEPDQIVEMPVDYDVPAEGVVEYKYFILDPGWKEDKWIKAAEARPGNRAVVHHIVATPGPGFAPGMPATVYPEGVAEFVPAGTKIRVQMHYTPNGSPQKDRSKLGFIFCDESEVTKIQNGGLIGTWTFAIPPNDPNYKIVASQKVPQDMLLTSMLPHMHLRGKSFRYEADFPDGTSRILLDVPNYDFNWQLRYKLSKPILMPKGTTFRIIAHFDNSRGNLANPDPTETVRYGDQTWEEMVHGFYGSLPVETIQEQRERRQQRLKQSRANTSDKTAG